MCRLHQAGANRSRNAEKVFSRPVQTLAVMSGTHFDTAVALMLALASSTLVSVAYLREHAAVGVLPALSLRRPVQSLRLLVSSRAWLTGFAMESSGFALYVTALALAPLALVQSVAAGGIGILALASARLAHRRLTKRETLGAGVSVAGLLFLSLSLIGGGDQSAQGSLVEIGLWLGGTFVAAVLVLTVGRAFLGAATAFGIAGGLLFSCGDISIKLATQGGARVAFALVAISGYVLGTSLLQIGYQRGAALTIAGIATLLTNALPIAAGPVLLNETLPEGGLRVLRILSFATVIAGAALLARPSASASSERPLRAAVGP
jgi:drug/metabolite transporter (DMT)-like permease